MHSSTSTVVSLEETISNLASIWTLSSLQYTGRHHDNLAEAFRLLFGQLIFLGVPAVSWYSLCCRPSRSTRKEKAMNHRPARCILNVYNSICVGQLICSFKHCFFKDKPAIIFQELSGRHRAIGLVVLKLIHGETMSHYLVNNEISVFMHCLCCYICCLLCTKVYIFCQCLLFFWGEGGAGIRYDSDW